jgi:EF hand
MKIPLFTISLLLTLPAPQVRGQTVDPVNSGRRALPPTPVDPALVPGSASVEVETDAAQNPAPSTTKPRARRPVTEETPPTVVVKPKNPFSGFRKVDGDSGGTISLRELTTAFRRADTDFDGLLSLEEFQRGIVDQPLDAGGVPDPPQIIVVPPKEDKETGDGSAAGQSTPARQNPANTRSRNDTRRQNTQPTESNTEEDLDDVDLDDVDFDDVEVDQTGVAAPTGRNRATNSGRQDRTSASDSNTEAETQGGNSPETNNPNAIPNSGRDNSSAASRNRSRTITERRAGSSSTSNASTRDSSGSSTRTRPSGNRPANFRSETK